MKRIISLIISCCMILGLVPVSTSIVSAETYSGTCGDNLTWTLSNDGELIISGTGDIPGNNYWGYEWYEQSDLIRKVKIENGVTGIYGFAFSQCINLTDIVVSESVISIDSYACGGCYNLKNIDVNNDNKYLSSENGVLFNKDKTTIIYYPHGKGNSYTIPDGTINIGSNAFSNFDELIQIVMPSSVKTIGNSAFYNCKNLEKVLFSDSLTSIGDDAFNGCSKLSDIVIKKDVTSIGENAFSNCENLKSIDVDSNNSIYYSENGVLLNKDTLSVVRCPQNMYGSYTIPDNITSVGNSAFSGCSGLININIPDSVKSIGNSAFSGCSGLISIIIPKSITNINSNTFSGCKNLYEITIPNTIKNIGMYAFYECSRLNYVYCEDENWYCYLPEGNGDFKSAKKIYTCTNDSYKIENDVLVVSGELETIDSSLSDALIDYKDSIKSIFLNSGIKSIGDNTFKNFSKVVSVTLPDGLLHIGDYAFESCNSLKNINMSDSVTSIGEAAFSNCTVLKNIRISDNVNSIGNYAFCNCTSLIDVMLPSSLTKINHGIFYNCNSLFSITIPISIVEIEQDAFYNCGNLTDIYYGGLLSDWGDITIKSGNTSINNAILHPKQNDGKDDDIKDENQTILGEGTEENPYQLYSFEHLSFIKKNPSAYYILMNDINMTSEWMPIGVFSGVLKGNNYTIHKNLVNENDFENMCLIEENNGVIDNINLVLNVDYVFRCSSSNISCLDYSAIALNNKERGIIRNCSINGEINFSIDFFNAGGDSFVFKMGYISTTNHGTIENCNALITSEVIVTGQGACFDIGGICETNFGNITNSYLDGKITASAESMSSIAGIANININKIKKSNNNANISYTGGFLDTTGYIDIGGGIANINSGEIEDCYNSGNVVGGGIVGGNYGLVSNCYNTGNITGIGAKHFDGAAGIAANNRGTIEKCYNMGKISSADCLGGIAAFTFSGDGACKITDCYNSGEIKNPNEYGGGIVAETTGVKVINCYNCGNLFNTSGIVGSSEDTEISQCYNIGNMNITNKAGIGGIVGSASETTINDCYCSAQFTLKSTSMNKKYMEGQTWGILSSGRAKINRCYSLDRGICLEAACDINNCFYLTGTSAIYTNPVDGTTSYSRGTAKTKDDLKFKKTFTSEGWDFRSLWDIDPNVNNGFPYLNPREPDPGYDAETGRFTQINFIIGKYYNYGTKKYNFTPTPNATITCNGVTKTTDENGEVSYSAEESGYDGYKISPVQLTCEGYFSQTYSYVPVPKDGIIQLSISQKNPDSIYISNVTMNDVKGISHDLTYYRTVNIYKTDTDNYTFSVDVDWNNHEPGEIYLQTRNGSKKIKFEDGNTLTIPLAQTFDVSDELVIWAYTADKAISMSKILNVDICALPEEYSLKLPEFHLPAPRDLLFFDYSFNLGLDNQKGLERNAKVTIEDNNLILAYDHSIDAIKFKFINNHAALAIRPHGKLSIPIVGGGNWEGEIGGKVAVDDLIKINKQFNVKIPATPPIIMPVVVKVDLDAALDFDFGVTGPIDNPVFYKGSITPEATVHAFGGPGVTYDYSFVTETDSESDTMEISIGAYGDFTGKLPIEFPLDVSKHSDADIKFDPSLKGEFGLEANVKVFIIDISEDFEFGRFTWDKNGFRWGKDESTINLMSIDDTTVKLHGREYLNDGGGFVGDLPSISLFDLEVTNKDEKMIYENIYSNSETKIQNVSGQKILYFLIDDTAREEQNGLVLTYSEKNADGTWSAPKKVNDDGTLDTIIEADGDFVVWENSKNIFSDDVSLDTVLKDSEISVAKFNGTAFDTTVLTNNDIYDFSPVVKSNGSKAIAAWLSNDNSDFTASTGTTNLHYSLFDGSTWSETQTIENIGKVSRVTTAYNNDQAYVFYKKDGKLCYVNTDGNVVSELSYNNIGQYTVSTFNGKVYLAYFDRVAGIRIVEDLLGEANIVEVTKSVNSNSIPSIATNDDDLYVTWIENKNGYDILSGVRYSDGSWSDVIDFVDEEMNVKKPSLIVNEDGSFSASYLKTGKRVVQEDGTIYSGLTNLYVNTIVPSYNLAISEESVSYDDTAYSEGKNVGINFDIENIGEKNVEGFDIEIYDGDSLLHSENKTEILRAGETKNISVEINPLNNGQFRNITIKVLPEIVDDFDESDNSVTFEIGTFDPEVSSAYFTYNGYTYSVNADIINSGSITENCTVQIHKESADGEVIYETEIENIKPLETIFVTYEMPIDTELNNCYITVSSENDVNEYNNYSIAVYENFDEEIKEKAITFDKTTNTATIKSEKEYKDAVVFFATYNNGKLVSLKKVDKDLIVGENTATPEDFSLDGADTVKVMVWESSLSLKPLFDVCVVDLNRVSYNIASKTVTITSNAAHSNANVYVAAYQGGKLLSLKSRPKNIAIGDTTVVFSDFDSTGADTIKVMVWGSASNIKPLFNTCVVELK